MLPRLNRLLSQDISPILKTGKRIRGEAMDLVYKTTSHPPRFAVVVSSKIDKRATHRNRMKRLVREAVRRQLPSIENGVDGVLIVRRRIPDSEQEVEGIMTELLKKAELLNTE